MQTQEEYIKSLENQCKMLMEFKEKVVKMRAAQALRDENIVSYGSITGYKTQDLQDEVDELAKIISTYDVQKPLSPAHHNIATELLNEELERKLLCNYSILKKARRYPK
jgi:archaellum component FlaC